MINSHVILERVGPGDVIVVRVFGPPDDASTKWSIVQVDVCAGFLIQTKTTHPQCASEDKVEWFKQAIVPLAP